MNNIELENVSRTGVDKIINKIICFYPEEWKFICENLNDNNIDEIIENITVGPKAHEELNLIDDRTEEDILHDILAVLGIEVNKKIWHTITKEQVNNLLQLMADMGITSVNIGPYKYTAEDIVNSWRTANNIENK